MKILNEYSSEIGSTKGFLQFNDSKHYIFNVKLSNEYFDIPKSKSKKISIDFSGSIKTGIITTNKFWAEHKNVVIEKGIFIEDIYED